MSKRAILFCVEGTRRGTVRRGPDGEGTKCMCVYKYERVNIFIHVSACAAYTRRIAPIKPRCRKGRRRPRGTARGAGDAKGKYGCISLEFRTQLHIGPTRGTATERFCCCGGAGERTFVCAHTHTRLFPVPSRKRKTGSVRAAYIVYVLKGSRPA